MNIQIKSSLIIIFTLMIGLLLGVLIDRTIMRVQFQKRVGRMRSPEGFIHMMERIVEPDESQREEIIKILNKYSNRFHEIAANSHAKMVIVMDSLRTELDPVLTGEQKARLKNRMEHIRSWRKDGPPFRRPKRHHFDRRENHRPPGPK